LTWIAGGVLIAATAGFQSWLCFGGAHDSGLAVMTLVISPVTFLVALLGVYLWARVEEMHVPEALLHFARNGMVAPARRAVEHGVSPNVQNEQGETALLLAATNGQTEMVKFLLLHGANPAIPDLLGYTALVARRHTD